MLRLCARPAGNDIQIRRGIDRTAVDDHPKIQMWTVSKTRAADGCDFFTAVNIPAAPRQNGRDQSEMAVDAHEPIMLDQDLEAPDPVPLNPDDSPRRDCDHWAADLRRKIDPVVKCPGQGFVRQDTRPER